MAQLSGYVKIHRKLLQWGWYSDHVVKDVFLHVIFIAAFKEGEYLGYQIKPGQAIVSSQKIADELGFSRQQVRTALKKLESTKEISLISTNKFTIVTVENWTDYQMTEFSDVNFQPMVLDKNKMSDNFLSKNQSAKTVENSVYTDQCVTNEQPSSNHQVTTSEECKESNNVKNDNYYSLTHTCVCAQEENPFDHDVILENLHEDYQPNLIAMRQKKEEGLAKWRRENP